MKYVLITHIDDTTSILAEEHNYILVTRKHPDQSNRNARQDFFGSLADCFPVAFERKLKAKFLADNRDKSIEEVIDIINTTRKEMKEIVEPFENIQPLW